jgi:regulatory protein
MDYLARRSHSELELRQKLSRDYAVDDVEDAIQNAHQHGWMMDPEELSQRVSIELGRKRKGHRFINQFLKNKGLPPIARNSEDEMRKCRAIITSKLSSEGPFNYEEQKKIYRWLTARGFDDETIRRAIKSKD